MIYLKINIKPWGQINIMLASITYNNFNNSSFVKIPKHTVLPYNLLDVQNLAGRNLYNYFPAATLIPILHQNFQFSE